MSQLIEKRSFDLSGSEIKETRNGFDFRGYAAVFATRSVPMLNASGTFTEVVMPGAFKRAIEERQDVLFTVDHDPKRLLGRTSSGTVALAEDSKGLEVRSTLPNTQLGRDTAEMIARRDLNGMSFMFIASPGGSTFEQRNGERIRTLTDFARVPDVCVTAVPAYKETEADVEARMLFEALTELRTGKMISAANKDIIANAISALQALINEEQAEEDAGERSAWKLKLDLIEKYGGIAEARDSAYQPQPYQKDADETIQCPQCGSYNSPDAQYCDQCGNYLVGEYIVEP